MLYETSSNFRKSIAYIKTMNGTIKTLKTEQGFGFISREGEEKDLFFHANALSNVAFTDLQVGDSVTFDVTESDKGPAAINVTRA